MEKITETDAKIMAQNLSRNLYYEDEFNPGSLRVFLDNLPKVAFVHFNLRKVDDYYLYPSCSAQITFVESNYRKPILIVMANSWQFETYWVKHRRVPVRYLIDGFFNSLKY